jgi:hypothetical protein
MSAKAFSRERFLTSPGSGKFGGSPASLLIVSVLAFYCAIVCVLEHLHGQSARTSIPLAVIFFAVSIGALYLSGLAWKKHGTNIGRGAGR